jgi:hypothetical protein
MVTDSGNGSRCVCAAEGEEIVTPVVEPTDLELIRKIAAAGGRKYTAGNLDRRKYQRLVALGWLTEVSVNISDVLYEVTEAGKAAALRDGSAARPSASAAPTCGTSTRTQTPSP